MSEITARYHQPKIYARHLCDDQDWLEVPACDFELVFTPGTEDQALALLDAAYERLKQQIDDTRRPKQEEAR